MDKLVYTGAVLIALALIAGSIFIPTSLIMTLASTSDAAFIARGVLVLLMVVLIVTNPPRRHEVRLMLGIASVGFLWMTVQNTLGGSIHLADSFLYLQASIAFAIEALESGISRRSIEVSEAKTRAITRGLTA